MIKKLLRLVHGPIYESRIRALTRLIAPTLQPGDRVLDVGCGSGVLAKALQDSAADRSVRVEGIEKHPRGGEAVPVTGYDGKELPFPDATFDVVIIADVLHHEVDPDFLLQECARICRRNLVVKDHQLAGPFAQSRISFLDWAANAGYGVKCLYQYLKPDEWGLALRRAGLRENRRIDGMKLYPFGFEQVFGGRLHILLIASKPDTPLS